MLKRLSITFDIGKNNFSLFNANNKVGRHINLQMTVVKNDFTLFFNHNQK